MSSEEMFVPKSRPRERLRNSVALESETHKTIKMIAADKGVPMQRLVEEILTTYIVEMYHRKPHRLEGGQA